MIRRTPTGSGATRIESALLAPHRAWLPWLAIALVYVVLRLNALAIPLDRDEGMFGYIGRVIADGGLPYRDVFEHKPPVGFYVHALAAFLAPPTAVGIHAFLQAYNFLTLVVLFFVARTYTGSRSVGLWVAFAYAVFSSSPAIQGFTASTEMFLLLPLSLSLLGAVLAAQRHSILLSAASGLFGALAFGTKQTAGAILAFVGLYLFASLIGPVLQKRITLPRALSILVAWLAGFFAVVLLFVGYFAYHGAFDEFLYWSLTHSLIYTDRISGWQSLPRIAAIGLDILRGNFLLVLPGLVVSLYACAKREPVGFFMAGLWLSSLVAAAPGTVYRHYFAQTAPAVAMTGGWAVAFCLTRIPSQTLRQRASIGAAAALVALPVWAHAGYYFEQSPVEFSRAFFGGNPFPESEDVAAFLAEGTDEDESIFIYGSEAQILLLAERRSATPFALIYPLMSEYPRYREFQERAWQDIERNRPRYILLVQMPVSLLWDGKADLWIARKTRALLDQDYFLEAAMTVAQPKGELRVFGRDGPWPSRAVLDRLPILVYRRIDRGRGAAAATP